MMIALANHIAEYLYNMAVIEEADVEIYAYGFFILISQAFFFLVILICGLLLKVTWESLLFYTMFMFLRSYAGGIHAKTETRCTILTTIAMLISSYGIRLLESLQCTAITIAFLMASTICVIALSPLDNENKPLTTEELNHYRKITNVIVAIYFIVALCVEAVGLHGVMYAITVCVFLEGILLITGKLKRLFDWDEQ